MHIGFQIQHLARAIVAAMAISATQLAAAVTFTVNSTLDQPDTLATLGTCKTAANTCTLRAAIMQANRSSGIGATVVVPAGTYVLTIPSDALDSEGTGDLDLATPVAGTPPIAIVGAGAGVTIIDANQIDRVFHVHVGRVATITGVAIRNGYADKGGGIQNQGSLTVDQSAISGNHATAEGGGIWNGNSLTVTKSKVTLNTAAVSGAGIFSFGDLNVRDTSVGPSNRTSGIGGGIYTGIGLTMRNSTVYANHANAGGGIYNEGTMTAMNATISGNDAGVDGGGIYNAGSAAMFNATIAFNSVNAGAGGDGGGVFSAKSATVAFDVTNSVLISNMNDNVHMFNDCSGTLRVHAADAFSFAIGLPLETCEHQYIGDHFSEFGFDPGASLAPLADNGGPTPTHALLSDAGLQDLGRNCVDYASNPLPTDQRGEPRVAGTACDLGAYEWSLAVVVEYYHAAFDHYFITSIPDEIAKLDAGTIAGWKRTGEVFKALPSGSAIDGRESGVCRFFSTTFAPKSSHFYTPDAKECADVQANPNWQFEATVFHMPMATRFGDCLGNAQPVYRMYNAGQGGAPNHRYTTSLAVRSQMLANAWVAEGYGPIGVIMCSPI